MTHITNHEERRSHQQNVSAIPVRQNQFKETVIRWGTVKCTGFPYAAKMSSHSRTSRIYYRYQFRQKIQHLFFILQVFAQIFNLVPKHFFALEIHIEGKKVQIFYYIFHDWRLFRNDQSVCRSTRSTWDYYSNWSSLLSFSGDVKIEIGNKLNV